MGKNNNDEELIRRLREAELKEQQRIRESEENKRRTREIMERHEREQRNGKK